VSGPVVGDGDGAGLAVGEIHHDDVAVGQAVPPPGLDPAVDSHVPGLDGYAGLAAVLHETGEFEELTELDRPADADRAQ